MLINAQILKFAISILVISFLFRSFFLFPSPSYDLQQVILGYTVSQTIMSTAFSSSNFDSEEYFAFRPHYPQKLFDFIYAYHSNSSNATFSKAIDLASGCGQATFPLSLKLESVIGVEPSDEMLKISNSLKEKDYRKIFDLPPVTSDSEKKNIEFVKGTAEKLDFLNDGSVDLILTTVGCNWFDWFSDAPSDENRIWKEFDRVLKPSGSVALVVSQDLNRF